MRWPREPEVCRECSLDEVLCDADEPAAHHSSQHHRRYAPIGDKRTATQLVPIGSCEITRQRLRTVSPGLAPH
eukprot:6440701-Alexandrium_andersonii.AAC.1